MLIDDKRYWIKAGIETISGYSAHSDQSGLINFVKRMCHKPKLIKIVHGDEEAKQTLKEKLEGIVSTTASSCEIRVARKKLEGFKISRLEH